MAGILPPRPLSADDGREAFDCGRPAMNDWFARHAWRNQLSGAARTSVICETDTGRICGYVSLCAAQIRRELLIKRDQRNQPDPVPVILLGQLAINVQFQRQGLAKSLLQFALTTAVQASQKIGAIGVITHPLDDEARAFYLKHGFIDLPEDPKRAMIVGISANA